jgi:hypothetical protein
MRVVAAVLVIVAACGGATPVSPDAAADATPSCPDGAAGACDPITQTGCAPGQKCTWIRVAISGAQEIGSLGCEPDGTVAAGGACTYGAAKPTTCDLGTGYDDCTAGLVCDAPTDVDQAHGTCAPICDVNASPGSCAAGATCATHTGYFANAGDPPTEDGLCGPP